MYLLTFMIILCRLIKLNFSQFMMTKTLLHSLEGDDVLKIFPQEYYTKYANHLKILQFEKLIIQEQVDKSHIEFKLRNTQSERRIKSAIPKQQMQRVKMNRFDTFYDTIQKNKQEHKRMNLYKNALTIKLKMTPHKRNIIRSPTREGLHLQDSVHLKMKAIEDLEFQTKQQQKRELKIELQKQSICKFVQKCKSAKYSARKKQALGANNPQNKSKSHRELALKLQQIAMQSLQRNESLHQRCTNRTQKQSSLINNVNIAIKRGHSLMKKASITSRDQEKIFKIFKDRGLSKTSMEFRGEGRKNLILQTKRIREEVKSIATVRRFEGNSKKEIDL